MALARPPQTSNCLLSFPFVFRNSYTFPARYEDITGSPIPLPSHACTLNVLPGTVRYVYFFISMHGWCSVLVYLFIYLINLNLVGRFFLLFFPPFFFPRSRRLGQEPHFSGRASKNYCPTLQGMVSHSLPNWNSSPVLWVFSPFFFLSRSGWRVSLPLILGGKEKKKREGESRTFARGFMSLFNNTSKWLPYCCPEERKRGTKRTADPTSSQGRKHEQVAPRTSPVAPSAFQ